MKEATLAQGNQVTNLILQKKVSSVQLQRLLHSGLLADLLEADFDKEINRRDFRRLIGFQGLFLELLEGSVSIPATNKQFVVREHFGVDISVDAEVNIGFLGFDFMNCFRDKVEMPFAGSTICSWRVRKASLDKQIISELGNNNKRRAETSLYEIWSLLKKQPRGEDGFLDTRGMTANIFYVPDSSGVLCSVNVFWWEGRWSVTVVVSESLDRWHAGCKVFSRV